MVHVKGYVRADGTKVRAHSRWAAGARRGMSVLVAIALVAVGFAGTSGSGSVGGVGKRAPRPGSTAMYPVKFPDLGQAAAPADRLASDQGHCMIAICPGWSCEAEG
ncbi:hypothetical protein, partial [Streptomyces aureus]|uniref:hypothetical protein n=1 Tax=Streptomyces aureus TaxID=193461 RepID=UPI0031D3484F